MKRAILTILTTLLLSALVGCQSEDINTDRKTNSAGTQLVNGSLALAVNGRGFLTLSDQDSQVYRRSDTFSLDANRFIVNAQGRFLKGFSENSEGRIVGILVDIKIPDIDPALINIDEYGLIFSIQNGVQTNLAKIAISTFISPYQLTETSSGLFTESPGSGDAIIGVPTAGLFGSLSVGSDQATTIDYTLELSTTDNSYFILDTGSSIVYTPSTLLFSDKQTFFIDALKNQILAYGVLFDEVVSEGETTDPDDLFPIGYWQNDLPPQASDQLTLNINLNSLDSPATSAFNHLNASTYNMSDEILLYDSIGTQHSFTLFFAMTDIEDVWQMYYQFIDPTPWTDGPQLGGPYTLEFDSFGGGITHPSIVQTESLIPNNGAESWFYLNLDISNITQAPQAYTANIHQNGYATALREKLTVEECGRVVVNYNNDIDLFISQIALASFPNPSGLTLTDDGLFVETPASGAPALSRPCTNGIAAILGDIID